MMSDPFIKKSVNIVKKVVILTVFATAVLLLGAKNVSAASATVEFAVPEEEVRVGDVITVTMTVTTEVTPGTILANISYSNDTLEFIPGLTCIAGGEGRLKLNDTGFDGKTVIKYDLCFLATAQGHAEIDLLKTQITDDTESEVMSISSMKSEFEVLTSLKASSDASLIMLKCNPGQLTPMFGMNCFEYSVQVPANVTDLTVSASPNDPAAEVSLSGNTGLKAGVNIITVRVTAEDGTVQDYMIYATKQEDPNDPGISDADRVDTGDSSSTKEPVSHKAFYSVEEEDGLYLVSNSYFKIVIDGTGVTIPDGYVKTTMVVSGNQVTAYAPENTASPDHLLLVLESEGEGADLFVYDRSQKTVQRYYLSRDEVKKTADAPSEVQPAVNSNETGDSELETELRKTIATLAIIVASLGAVTILLVILIVRMVTVRRKKRRR